MRTEVLGVCVIIGLHLCFGCERSEEARRQNWPPPLNGARTENWSARLRADLPETKRSAEFSGWSYVTVGGRADTYSWGPNAVEGEILIPENIFLIDVLPDLEAQNAFVVVDYGKDYTLIRLERNKGHRLCLAQRGINEAGIHLESTAALPGARVTVGSHTYEHRRDGWYIEGRLIHSTQIAPRE